MTAGLSKVTILMCLLAAATVAPVLGADVVGVEVENLGESLLDETAVLGVVGTRPGDTFDPIAISRDVRELEDSKRFSYVSADYRRDGKDYIVIFRVEPKPLIGRLKVEGADYLGNRKVGKLLELKIGDMVDDAILADRSQKVMAAYRKKYYPEARLTWDIAMLPAGGQADVLIQVHEGQPAKVRRIRFDGLTQAKPKELRKVMRQRKAGLFSFVTRSGKFNPDDVELDRLRIRRVLMDKGLLDAEVAEPVVSRIGRKKVDLTFPISEGMEYIVGDIAIEGHALFSEDLLKQVLQVRPGALASVSVIEASVQALEDYYGSRGYIRTRVDRRLRADPASRTVDITFAVSEGRLAHIRDIMIRGNTRTKDKVIRRELTIYPGNKYDQVRIRQSERRLLNLGYFSYAQSMSERTPDPDIYDLVFEVEEQRSGQLVVGVGFSSIDQITGFLEVSQGNFDILGWPHFQGAGQKLRLRLQAGTSRRDVLLSFTEPWFLNRRLRLTMDLFQNESRFYSDDYDQRNTGGSLSLTRPLFGPYQLRGIYSLQEIDVTDVAEDASDEIKQEAGATISSDVTAQLIYDTRNHVFVPTRGMRSVFSSTLSGGFLGGETDFYRVGARSVKYWPMWFDHILFVRGRAGVVEEYGSSEEVRIFDRYFLGGPRTLRGFDFRDVGPKDENGEPLGGKTEGFASIEYTIPIVEKVRVAGFYDIGMVWAEAYDFDLGDYNSDYGFGVRLDLPGFPLHLDYAWPLEADEFNDSSSGRFQFLIGYPF